ncbi:CRISPR-associated endonuclease Cas3'' [Thermus filiformis]|uniref:CRISPR-associated protein Cas3 n=1 Tax=Thermus filiformis TaxID=276 RepID=A0A0A2WST0_THEFI|nr:CRISPR-associated endonuclease Cas3'' [Thermus filiformis]KGQ22888.2 CRISPR-associated protein Cas3 [Thermus filiformis]
MRLLARLEPEEGLLEHLQGVGELAEGFLSFGSGSPQLEGLDRLGSLAGRAHDLGKATPYFQQMLRGERPKGDPLAWHALPGALFAAWAALQEGLEKDALPLFLAVLGHHGGLETPWEKLPAGLAKGRLPQDKKPWAVLPRQLEALKTEEFQKLVLELGLPDPLPFLEGGALEAAKALAKEANRLLLRPGEDTRLHYRTALLYSALIDADRRLAGGAPSPPKPRPIPPEAVASYKAKKAGASPLSPHREALFRRMEEVLAWPLEDLFPARLTLTAPTGAGKTLSALRFALGLRERVGRELGFLPKVVYALPYVSIADQVEEEARRVLEEAGLPPEEHLLVHHHLALARTGEETSLEEALLLQETWDREVVVTTFHQVFSSLVGPGSPLRHLHGLAQGSILLLDEVQTLPAELWPALRALLRDLPGRVTVVSMTATQPRLLEGKELAPPFPDYPRRVLFRWAKEGTLEALADRLLREGPRARLLVLNTVREAVELYRLLRGELPHLHLLTSHHIPKHRRKILSRVRQGLKEGLPVTLVATQVVEAGVDLDFPEGYRAFAPLESLLQVGGRVNRNALGEGTLWVLDLEGGSERRVYGAVLPDRTRRLLEGRLEEGVWDTEAYALLPEYYRLVEEGISQEEGRKLLEHLASLDYGRVELDLVGEVPSLPIFVEWDEEASALLARLEEALALKDPRERRKVLRLLLPRLEAYTVSPLLRRALKNLPPPLLGREEWRHVPREALPDFYEEEVGFKWEMETFL